MQKIVKQIIKDLIDPLFKENGFKKKRNNYAKIFPDFAWVVNIQFSKWNTQENVEFTFNVGISVDKLYGTYYEREKPKFPVEVESVLPYRISELKKSIDDHWYILKKDTSIDELKKQIQSDIQVIISHFEDFQTIKEIITELEYGEKTGKPTSPRLLSVLFREYGNAEKAQKYKSMDDAKEFEQLLIPKEEFMKLLDMKDYQQSDIYKKYFFKNKQN